MPRHTFLFWANNLSTLKSPADLRSHLCSFKPPNICKITKKNWRASAVVGGPAAGTRQARSGPAAGPPTFLAVVHTPALDRWSTAVFGGRNFFSWRSSALACGRLLETMPARRGIFPFWRSTHFSQIVVNGIGK